jgi:hypothetical protein
MSPKINIVFNGFASSEDIILAWDRLTKNSRKDTTITTGKKSIDFINFLAKAFIEDLQIDVMDKSFTNKMHKTIITYRAGENNNNKFLGYTSTSLSKMISYEYLRSTSVFYTITIPKGTPYVYLEMNKCDNVASKFKFQYEVLLPRGATYSTQRSVIQTVKNPRYRIQKKDPYIKVLHKWITITGFKPTKPEFIIKV